MNHLDDDHIMQEFAPILTTPFLLNSGQFFWDPNFVTDFSDGDRQMITVRAR
ncbi:MAG: hypothetical protein P9X24_18230 [Candidatus Hatepunaea meridiana]|nr:hypothetical protein [Candidatus Hatepunaea meridiana]